MPRCAWAGKRCFKLFFVLTFVCQALIRRLSLRLPTGIVARKLIHMGTMARPHRAGVLVDARVSMTGKAAGRPME